MRLSSLHIVPSKAAAAAIPAGKVLINTINAHSFNVAQKDAAFAEALTRGDYLLPDGASIVMACKWLKHAVSHPVERVAGWDLFEMEMQRLNERGGRCMFMGSSEAVLAKIKERAANVYPNIEVTTYSPPYKAEFSADDNAAIIMPRGHHRRSVRLLCGYGTSRPPLVAETFLGMALQAMHGTGAHVAPLRGGQPALPLAHPARETPRK